MDKLVPAVSVPGSSAAAGTFTGWYKTEHTGGKFTASEVAWMYAAGWRPVSVTTFPDGSYYYNLSRRVINTETVLQSLTNSYSSAYTEGVTANNTRYSQLLVLYSAVLDKSEDAYNVLEADDTTYEGVIEGIIASIATDHTTYAADVDGDLDDWGTDLLAEINARFDAESSKAQQSLIDRGLYSATMWTTISAGVERERTRALNNANDTIEQRQLELKHKVQDELVNMRSRVLAARDRLRVYLRAAKESQVDVRNALAQYLGGVVERRVDSYPDLSEIGRAAASIGAGSSGYAP